MQQAAKIFNVKDANQMFRKVKEAEDAANEDAMAGLDGGVFAPAETDPDQPQPPGAPQPGGGKPRAPGAPSPNFGKPGASAPPFSGKPKGPPKTPPAGGGGKI